MHSIISTALHSFISTALHSFISIALHSFISTALHIAVVECRITATRTHHSIARPARKKKTRRALPFQAERTMFPFSLPPHGKSRGWRKGQLCRGLRAERERHQSPTSSRSGTIAGARGCAWAHRTKPGGAPRPPQMPTRNESITAATFWRKRTQAAYHQWE